MEKNQNPVTQTEVKTEGVVDQPTNQNDQKTYTQEEYNALDIKLKKQYEKKYEGIDIAKYREWEKSQLTESEKMADLIKKNEALEARILEAENRSVVANAGVDQKFQKFVLSEVSTLEGDFEENLKTYLKDNTQYLVQKNESKPTTTGFPQNNTNPGVSEEKAYLDKKYAKNPYYKK